MQCGPASVEAVRRGELGMGYDVDFVFAEVNSDIQTFLADPTIGKLMIKQRGRLQTTQTEFGVFLTPLLLCRHFYLIASPY